MPVGDSSSKFPIVKRGLEAGNDLRKRCPLIRVGLPWVQTPADSPEIVVEQLHVPDSWEAKQTETLEYGVEKVFLMERASTKSMEDRS